MLIDTADQRVNSGIVGTDHLKFQITEEFKEAGISLVFFTQNYSVQMCAVAATSRGEEW